MKRISVKIICFLFLGCLFSCSTQPSKLFLSSKVEPAGLEMVRLTGGPFLKAMELEEKYLLSLDADRLLSHFRFTAGLDSLKTRYGGWEVRELRGHTLGHYLSACSMMYASTGDSLFKAKTKYIVNALAECQKEYGTGYVSAFPEEFIDRVENTKPVWAPYYTLHKIMAGLFDTYKYTGNKQALDVLSGIADWCYNRCIKLSHEKMQTMLLRTEQGGMNEVLYNLARVTGNQKYKELAKMFYEEHYFIPLSEYRDTLKGEHVNSYIPNVIGIARGYQVTGDKKLLRMADWFWKDVTEARSYITGGTSNFECWRTYPYHMETELGAESHESCCTYNMLKLTGLLFTENQLPAYADYFEKALWNGILPTQDTLTGMSMYYIAMQPGYYKTYGTPTESFWCCTGTGMENFSKSTYGIYWYGNNKLFVNLFMPTVLSVPSEGFTLIQETAFPDEERTTITLKLEKPSFFELNLRIPEWIGKDYSISLNGKKLEGKPSPGSFIQIERIWKNGDKIEYYMPMYLKINTLPATHKMAALQYGPVVLAGCLSDSSVAETFLYGQYGPYKDKPQAVIPVPVVDPDKDLTTQLRKTGLLSFRAAAMKADSVDFIPFYKLFGRRYMIYFPLNK